MSDDSSSIAISDKHPKGLWFLFATEMWERFGFYLMLGIFHPITNTLSYDLRPKTPLCGY
jgi:dipeptide/tripeptide permease